MPRYTFTGAYPRVLTGLREGVNAHLEPGAPPYGATIEASPGETVTTDADYEHPEMAASAPDTATTPAPAPDPAATPTPGTEPTPATATTPEPAGFDPAHDTMTTDGAPAPATA